MITATLISRNGRVRSVEKSTLTTKTLEERIEIANRLLQKSFPELMVSPPTCYQDSLGLNGAYPFAERERLASLLERIQNKILPEEISCTVYPESGRSGYMHAIDNSK